MRISKRGEYALRALINLGIAREVGRGVVQTSELAGGDNIPVKFLEQILVQMKNARILESRRGKGGGYTLAKRPSEIRIGDVVRLLDGPLAPIGCVSQSAYAPCSCPDEKHCGLRALMLDVRNAIASILDGATLESVVGVTVRRLRRDRKALPFARKRAPARARR